MKTYLITGGAGFIGSNFIQYILKTHQDIAIVNLDALTYAGNLENLKAVESDNRYKFVQGDINDAEKVKCVFQENVIDYVVNFAAESHVDRSIMKPEVFVKTNVLGTMTLLKEAKQAWEEREDVYRNGVRFLQVSTDEVYGSLGRTGLFTESTPIDPHSPYSASKAAADLLCKSYWDSYRFPINITRCSNNYGPYQFPEKLIPLMINNALQMRSLPVYGDGMQVRDWLYVEDHCRALDFVLKKGAAGEVYNIGGNNERCNIEIVKNIISYLGKRVDRDINETLIKFVKDRKGHDQRYGIDASKIKKDLGWRPQTGIDAGLQLTIEWYLENAQWIQNVTGGAYQRYYEEAYKGR